MRDTVWAHIRELRSTCDTTNFMTTHYREEAQARCPRVGFLHAGVLVARGSLDELRAASARPEATLDERFAHYTGESAEAPGDYGETSHTRHASRRLS
jgi:ABC-2 type transport system ATP-binding protein